MKSANHSALISTESRSGDRRRRRFWMRTLKQSAIVLIVAGAASNAGCAINDMASHQVTPSDSASSTESTPPRMDFNHAAHVGAAYYPKKSVGLAEEGICRMAITVEPDGGVSESHLVRSSGLPRLDTACLNAFPSDVRYFPATMGARPVRKTVIVPIVWCFGENCRDRAEALTLRRLQ